MWTKRAIMLWYAISLSGTIMLMQMLPTVAAGAGGLMVDDLDDSRDAGQAAVKGGAEGAKALSDFARKKGNFNKAAMLGACNGKPSETAEKLVEVGDKKLAAGVIAADAMAAFLFEHNSDQTIYKNLYIARMKAGKIASDESDGAAPSPKKGVKHPKKGKAAKNSDVLGTVLKDRDPETVRIGLLAAAYGADQGVKDLVLAAEAKTASARSAVLLYRTAIGDSLTDEEFARHFKDSLQDRGGTQTASRDLSAFSFEQPAGVMACTAAALRKNSSAIPLLIEALDHIDIRVQAEAAWAIAMVGGDSPEALTALIQKLARCQWPVLIEVCRALGAQPDARAIPPLVGRLKNEKGRFRLDVVHALSSIAGDQKGATAEEWEDWWKKSAASFRVDQAASRAFRAKTRVQDISVPTLGFFYALPIYSDRICFVVDSSMSMRGERMASLRENLSTTIHGLNSIVMYNIVNYGGTIEVMKRDTLVRDKPVGKQRAADMDFSTGTRSFDGMEVGMRLEDVDTFYYLSDGKPVKAEITEWDEMRRGLMLTGMTRWIAIFAVEFNPSGNTRSMVEMTDENFGLYDAVVLTGSDDSESSPGAKDPAVRKKGGGKAGGKGAGKKK